MLNQSVVELKSDVEENTSVIDSAILLIKGIAERIDDAISACVHDGVDKEDLEAIQEVSAALKKQNKALADAVVANTPTEETE